MIVTPQAERFGEEQRRMSERARAETREEGRTSAEAKAETEGGGTRSGNASVARLTFYLEQPRGSREQLQLEVSNTPDQLLVSRPLSIPSRASSVASHRTAIFVGSEESPGPEGRYSEPIESDETLSRSPSSACSNRETAAHLPGSGAQDS